MSSGNSVCARVRSTAVVGAESIMIHIPIGRKYVRFIVVIIVHFVSPNGP